jgi:endonuclease/exonuclease/phosphatase family metal-dependent hydrolase
LERPASLSLKGLCFRHQKKLNFLWLNTYLMPTIVFNALSIKKNLHDAAPARIPRSQEIGQMIKEEDFDVAILCEAWTEDSRTTILNNWNIWPIWIIGPDKSYISLEVEVPGVSDILEYFGVDPDIKIVTVELASSGLFTILPGKYGLLAHNRTKFSTEGAPLRDADAWSNKGVLQVVVETGYSSNIEFYSTHLIFGNDLIKSSGDTETVVADIAKSQIDNLFDFINSTHNPSNVIVVAGDFNIADNGINSEYLRHRMEDELGLEDVWARYSRSKYYAQLAGTENNLAFPDDPGNNEYICDRTGTDGCGEGVNDSRRIDYVFVQKPSSNHNIHIEVSRPRRRHFKRNPDVIDYNEIQTLSDHVGIELKLYISDAHVFAEPTIG